ncbi:MAG: mechanosensitive ion channel family protein [Bacteroidetes bacterium]|nr:MAG: mechanosensitive ion channel family protein [Bacteroidota bacterium]
MRSVFLTVCCSLFFSSLLFAQIDSADVHGSPFGVVYNHLYYLQPDSYAPEKAARSFNLDNSQAQTLAIQLKHILDGNGLYIDINRLPTQRSYFDSSANEAIYFLDRDFPLLYVERIDSNWYYSRTTVEAIPRLHDELYPFGINPAVYFQGQAWQYKILNIQLWKWLGLLISLLVSILVFYLIRWITNNLVYPVVKKRIGVSTEVRTHIRALARLFGLWGGLWFFLYGLPMFQLPPLTSAVLVKGLGILGIFFILFMLNRLLSILFFNLRKVTAKTENTLDDQLLPVLKRISGILVWILGIIYILDTLDVNITALLAGISIGGLAIALAAQDTVKNFFGSIMIFVDKPFQIGDWIHFGNVDGVVEEVGVRSTRIRTFANSLTYVPNGMLADQIVDNMGLRVYRRFKSEIGVTYDTPPPIIDLFVKGIREIILRHPTTRKDYFEVHLNNFGASSLNILLYTFFEAPNWTAELKGRHELMYAIIVLAHDLGVRFAFPTQTLHIEELPGHVPTTPKPRQPKEAALELQQSLDKIAAYFQEATNTTNEKDAAKFKPLGGE